MLRSRVWILGLLTASVAACAEGGPTDNTKVTVIKADGYDVSPPLTELAKIPVPELSGLRAHEAEPARPIPHMRLQSAAQEHDPVVQNAIGPGPAIPSPITSFDGMGTGLAGFTVQSAPPDTDGDVGPNHYVQIVNSSVTIFNKTGGKLLGPVLTRTFFANFAAGTNCQNTNDGDGVVRYDRLADRWVIAQFSVNGGNGPFFQCVAVSTTPDPTGSYNRYQFSYGATGFNDYPKMGLWPDGYYTTYNIFTGNTFSGAKSCAFDRAKMLTGAAATQICFDTGNTVGGLLASDLDGPTLPPAGSPNFQLALDTNLLVFFKMHVDFATPANSTFVGPTNIATAAFTPLCNGGTCVVQPGTTNRLDSLADRLMNRLVYRNFGDHEALLVSHSVTAGTGGGVRFYELRSPATTPTIFQQGTYAPDSAFRFMSSMAFDKDGNMGMGFAISSSTINPSVRYTGRLAGDALGTMGQGEATIVAGTGSQTGNLTRWGDYSSLNIDPVDDSTFWYTGQYMGASGSFNWRTRIAAFKFLPLLSSLVQMQPNIANGGRAVAITIDPGNVNNMIVASESGGLFKSSNGGITWNQVSAATTFWFNDVKHLDGINMIAAANSDTKSTTGGGLWRSIDAGVSWTHVISIVPPVTGCAPDFAAYGLATETSRPRVWAGTSCGLAFSDDAGSSWSFLPVAPGYNNDKVYAVVVSSATRLVVLTDAGVKVTTDGGAHWTQASTGLPGNILIGTHNQITVSPRDPTHIYWSFNYWTSGGDGRNALYASWNGGTTWTSVTDSAGLNRPPFVKAVVAQANSASQYTLYFSNGGCILQRATVTEGSIPSVSPWTSLSIDHCDSADLAFSPTNGIPLLLATDGGVHKTTNGGASWTSVGAAGNGYAALQITEVTGQLHDSRDDADLYFATQDNSIWASPDTGVTWPANRCCEGFFLRIPRTVVLGSKLTGVSCAGCGNFISDAVLAGQGPFPEPDNANGNPVLLKARNYLFNTQLPGLTGNIFDLTTDTGATWHNRFGFPEDLMDLPKSAGPDSDPVVYAAIKLAGTLPDGNPKIGIKRITGILGSGTPTVSNVGGFGSLGIFPTMFAWYKPFGVDPSDANFLIVPDISDSKVKVSSDGGGSWTNDDALTNLVTRGGTFKFKWGPFTQVSAIGFDPDCAGHILVGTQQAGVISTFNHGVTWSTVAGSTGIPAVSSFFFDGKGNVVISSYGRGLWRLPYICSRAAFVPQTNQVNTEPTIYWKGGRVPIHQIHDPDVCPACGFFLISKGDIVDVKLSKGGQLIEVVLNGGEVTLFSNQGRRLEGVQLPFKTSIDKVMGTFESDDGLVAQTKQGAHVKGLFLEGTQLKGFVLALEDLQPDQLPRTLPMDPHIRVDIPRGAGQSNHWAVIVRGTGFHPGRPIQVAIDGKPLTLGVQATFDHKGNFSLPLPPTVGVGGHTVLVEQQGDGGTIRDASTFLITVQDRADRK